MCDQNEFGQGNYQQYNPSEMVGDFQSYDECSFPACKQCPQSSSSNSISCQPQEVPSNMMCYENSPGDCYMPISRTPQQSNKQQQQSSQSFSQYCDPSYRQSETNYYEPQQQQQQTEQMCFQPQQAEQMCYQPCEVPCEPDCQPQENCFVPSYADNNCQSQSSPFNQQRYIQPPRRESCKPTFNYKAPTIPMATDTVYRKSFEGNDSCTAACCRPKPAMPNGHLRVPCGPFMSETVTKLSYQPYCGVDRVRPIVPHSPSLLGKGPMQGLTTQKHDFVPKYQMRRLRFYPRDNIKRLSGRLERATIQRLSFVPPCESSRTQSFKPTNSYKRPELPMEFDTTQKLSYMPVGPSPRDEMPWAKKAQYKAPTLPFAKDTVAKLSYQPPGCFVDDPRYDTCNEQNYCDVPRAAC